ncbi:spore photoproduct lyase [Elusimicrobium simillimum]|uniref:SPL family radical SAM protein n=1 Tax=Elusimicrobium simillimum TaxID=3143438 RepID=UPI003C6FACA2
MEIKDLQAYLTAVLPRVGVNKTRELVRLLFEINKRDGSSLADILPASKNLNFESAKKILLQKRYPKNFGKVPLSAFYLPSLDLDFYSKAELNGGDFYPKDIFIDAAVKDTPLAVRAVKMFPLANVTVLDKKRQVGDKDYSKRTKTLYISEEKFDFIKRCPCTAGAAGCGYNLVNLGFGCVYECAYCFLQQYQNLHAVMLPANIDSFLEKIDCAALNKGPFERIRIGSGEFTDSLVFDHITQYSTDIINFFRTRPHIDFEFKTKSVNIDNILAQEPCENIVVGWSVNTPKIIETVEFLTPNLPTRLAAAKKVAAAGFGVAFHFDPVIIYDGWQEDYKNVIKQIYDTVGHAAVRWISVGTLRFSRELKKIVEARHPGVNMLLEEFLLGYDGKMRYSDQDRTAVYDIMMTELKKHFPKAVVYLCMENAGINKIYK